MATKRVVGEVDLNHKEMLSILLNGGVVVFSTNTEHDCLDMYLSNEGVLKFKCNDVLVQILNLQSVDGYSYREVTYIEEQWYDNIPEIGVICWVTRHNGEKVNSPRIVTKHSFDTSDSTHLFYIDTGYSFIDAIPLTFEEIKQYIYKG